jgi:prepilin-type processing-associated H-X9-DG protein
MTMKARRNDRRRYRIEGSEGSQGRRAFTLVELLMVLATVALLVAILLPTVQGAGCQARAVVCQSRLRQWGIGFAAFLDEYDTPVVGVGSDVWEVFWRRHCDRRQGLFLCPMASRYEVNANDPACAAREALGWGVGSKFTAWRLPIRTPVTDEPGPLTGSYGMNGTGLILLDPRVSRGRRVDRANVPVFLDGASFDARVQPTDSPPAYDGQLVAYSDIKSWCIDRHAGGINSLFLDWSVRKVGLKELWTLEWSPLFDRRGPWTRAGGVKAEDWPSWMRRFDDY